MSLPSHQTSAPMQLSPPNWTGLRPYNITDFTQSHMRANSIPYKTKDSTQKPTRSRPVYLIPYAIKYGQF